VNKQVLIHLSSKDVIHSFGIPLLRVKQDAIPGQSIPVTFTAIMTNDRLKEGTNRTVHLSPGNMPAGFSVLAARGDYKDAEGNVLLADDDFLGDDAIAALLKAGINEIKVGSDTPMEVACSQLCGLGHYRMRSAVIVQTAEEYQAWLDDEASYLEY